MKYAVIAATVLLILGIVALAKSMHELHVTMDMLHANMQKVMP